MFYLFQFQMETQKKCLLFKNLNLLGNLDYSSFIAHFQFLQLIDFLEPVFIFPDNFLFSWASKATKRTWIFSLSLEIFPTLQYWPPPADPRAVNLDIVPFSYHFPKFAQIVYWSYYLNIFNISVVSSTSYNISLKFDGF